MDNLDLQVRKKKEFLNLDLENEIIHELKNIGKIPEEQQFALNSFIQETSTDLYGKLQISESEQIGFFYTKDSDSLSVHYIRPTDQDRIDGSVRKGIMRALKPCFGFPAFSCDTFYGKNNVFLCTFIEYPVKGKEKERFEKIKKSNSSIWNFINYEYLLKEHKRKGESPDELL